MCSVWGEPLCQTAQSFMPESLYGANRNLIKVIAILGHVIIDNFLYDNELRFRGDNK